MAYIGNSPENIQRGKRFVYEFKATAGQTAFSGTDLNNQTLDLLEENEMGVYLNGVRLADSDDYNVSGDTLTLISAASLNDQLTVETQAEIANISSYTRAEADARYINYDGDIVAGDLQISGEVDAGSLIVDTDVLVVDATNNRVGVGTASPSRKLSVLGSNNTTNFEVTDASGGNTFNIYNNTTSGAVAIGTSSALMSFGFNGIDKVYFKSDGKVGIGTSSPSFDLQLNKSSAPTFRIEETTNTVRLDLRSNSDHTLIRTTSNHDMRFNTNQVDRMTIKNDGKVGIGTLNPVYQLHVNSGATNIVADFESTDGIAGIRLRDNSGNTELSASGNDFRVQPAGGTPAFAVTGAGNVGIGETSPDYRLEVKGTATSSTDIVGFSNSNGVAKHIFGLENVGAGTYRLLDSSNNNAVFFSGHSADNSYINAGNVGIGTTNPAKLLSLETSGDCGFSLRTTAANTNAEMWEITAGANSSSNADLTFRSRNDDGTGGQEVLRLQYGGNVGIGTRSPSQKFHVVGATKFETPSTSGGFKNYFSNSGTNGQDYWIMSTNNSNGSLSGGKFAIGTDAVSGNNAAQTRFVIDASGNVGIGTTSPDEKLHVAGTIKSRSNNYNENVIVKEGSSGSFTFSATELNPISGDNIAYFIFVSVYRPTSDITNDVASLIVHGVMPRGSNSSFSTISTKLGSGISSLTATNSGNSLAISTDSGTNFRCAVKVIAMGGTS